MCTKQAFSSFDFPNLATYLIIYKNKFIGIFLCQEHKYGEDLSFSKSMKQLPSNN